jgi:putative FmdB family regulatory protein
MPIYEYICNDCEARFERIVINRQQEIACPKCASKKATIQLSVFATSNGSSNGASAKSPKSLSGSGGCCGGGGGGCACH